MKLKTTISAFLMVLLLASCASIGAGSNAFCLLASPIYIDAKQDQFTDLTARQILDHDEIGRRECGWKRN